MPILPLGPLPIMEGYQVVGSIFMWGALIVAFLRMGQGLWYDSWIGGTAKVLVIGIAMALAVTVGMMPVFYIGLLGGLYGA